MGEDIVARLDLLAAWWLPGGPYPAKPIPNRYDAAVDARDEIVRLREALAAIAEDRWNVGNPPLGCVSAQMFARAALSGEAQRDG